MKPMQQRVTELERVDALLQTLVNETAACGAVFLTFRQRGDSVVIWDVKSVGGLCNWDYLRDGSPPSGFDDDDSDDALKMRDGQWCLHAPAARHFNRFSWLHDDLAQIAPWKRTDVFGALYQANGVEQQYRAILVDHGEVIGWVALFWSSIIRSRELVRSLVELHEPRLREMARQRHRSVRTSHRLLLDSSGDFVALDVGARQFLGSDRLRAIRRRAKAARLHESERCIDGYELSTIAMRGHTRRATLILVEPLEPVRIDMRRALTEQQLTVATRVAEGRSNKEVAQELNLSTNTVKYHLKNIYPIVGVTNRIELASFLRT